MNILTLKPEAKKNDKKFLYRMTRGANTLMKDVPDGTIIHVAGFVHRDDVNGKNEDVNVLSIDDGNSTVYSTVSPTFKDEFAAIADIMMDEPDSDVDFDIMVVHGVSKSGREFVTCALV